MENKVNLKTLTEDKISKSATIISVIALFASILSLVFALAVQYRIYENQNYCFEAHSDSVNTEWLDLSRQSIHRNEVDTIIFEMDTIIIRYADTLITEPEIFYEDESGLINL